MKLPLQECCVHARLWLSGILSKVYSILAPRGPRIGYPPGPDQDNAVTDDSLDFSSENFSQSFSYTLKYVSHAINFMGLGVQELL